MSKELINQYINIGHKLSEDHLRSLSNQQLKSYWRMRLMNLNVKHLEDYELKLAPIDIKRKYINHIIDSQIYINYNVYKNMPKDLQFEYINVMSKNKYGIITELLKVISVDLKKLYIDNRIKGGLHLNRFEKDLAKELNYNE